MRKRGRRNAIVRSAFVLIFIVLIASVINMQYELRDLRDKRTLLQEKVQDVQDNIQEMQMRLDTPLTDEYIERIAKEKLGYRKHNEIIYINNIAE